MMALSMKGKGKGPHERASASRPQAMRSSGADTPGGETDDGLFIGPSSGQKAQQHQESMQQQQQSSSSSHPVPGMRLPLSSPGGISLTTPYNNNIAPTNPASARAQEQARKLEDLQEQLKQMQAQLAKQQAMQNQSSQMASIQATQAQIQQQMSALNTGAPGAPTPAVGAGAVPTNPNVNTNTPANFGVSGLAINTQLGTPSALPMQTPGSAAAGGGTTLSKSSSAGVG